MKNRKKNRHNILFILTDQERENSWIPDYIKLPGREMLKSKGLEFKNHYTHTSPCSPSRASIFTGKYIHQHGVTENSSSPKNTQLSFDELTIGKILRNEGYRTAYNGKWHLQYGPQPDMDKFGFGDWIGNDMSFWGLPNSGTEYDPIITENAIEWLNKHAKDVNPWFLCVGLVNPHDGMWFPVDQKWYSEENYEYTNITRRYLEKRKWGRKNNLPGFSDKGVRITYKMNRGAKYRTGVFTISAAGELCTHNDDYEETSDVGTTLSAITSDGDSTAGNDTIRVQYTTTSDSSTDITMEYQTQIFV